METNLVTQHPGIKAGPHVWHGLQELSFLHIVSFLCDPKYHLNLKNNPCSKGHNVKDSGLTRKNIQNLWENMGSVSTGTRETVKVSKTEPES